VARKKPPARKKSRRRRRRRGGSGSLGIAVVIVIIFVLGAIGYVAFDDRHWQAFQQAGDVAFERGNHKYAERMYDEALQVARELDDPELIAATLMSLSRAYAAQGRGAEALVAARQARQLTGR
jgi:cytochrome c-type biogenesis protein CcmH/NrfG